MAAAISVGAPSGRAIVVPVREAVSRQRVPNPVVLISSTTLPVIYRSYVGSLESLC